MNARRFTNRLLCLAISVAVGVGLIVLVVVWMAASARAVHAQGTTITVDTIEDELPDVSRLLAERIGTRGVARVVGPDELGAAALGEPDAADVRAWASRADVEAVAVGRVTRIGTQLSVDVRLRSGESGDVAAPP